MTNKTSLEIECFCATCSNLLQPKSVRCQFKDGKDCFTITLEPCKTCERKALPQPQAQEQEAIMTKHAESGKFGDCGDMTSGSQPFQD